MMNFVAQAVDDYNSTANTDTLSNLRGEILDLLLIFALLADTCIS
jgi:hypothetical protein